MYLKKEENMHTIPKVWRILEYRPLPKRIILIKHTHVSF